MQWRNKMDKIHEIYCMMLEVHQANIQILKNQKRILQNLSTTITTPAGSTSDEMLIEETDNVLRQIING